MWRRPAACGERDRRGMPRSPGECWPADPSSQQSGHNRAVGEFPNGLVVSAEMECNPDVRFVTKIVDQLGRENERRVGRDDRTRVRDTFLPVAGTERGVITVVLAIRIAHDGNGAQSNGRKLPVNITRSSALLLRPQRSRHFERKSRQLVQPLSVRVRDCALRLERIGW